MFKSKIEQRVENQGEILTMLLQERVKNKFKLKELEEQIQELRGQVASMNDIDKILKGE